MRIRCELHDDRPFSENFVARITWAKDGRLHGIEAEVGPLRPADHGVAAFAELMKTADLKGAE